MGISRDFLNGRQLGNNNKLRPVDKIGDGTRFPPKEKADKHPMYGVRKPCEARASVMTNRSLLLCSVFPMAHSTL